MYMALNTLQVPLINLARPGSHCHSGPSRRPAASRISAKNHHQRSRSASVLTCRASLHGGTDDRSNKDRTTEIPVVPCPSVTFPGATLRLQAFEFRYRIMMQTVLQEGLEFGVVYTGKDGGGMADVGCTVRVVECERLVDGRFFLTCVGGDRFRVVEIVRTKPYVVARIQVLSEQRVVCAEPRDGMGRLVRQVEQHLKNVAVLSEKLNRQSLPQLRGGLHSAVSFSFLVARLFVDDRGEQQALLRVDDAAQRLAREGMYLERRTKYLAAVAAIKDAFQHLSCNDK